MLLNISADVNDLGGHDVHPIYLAAAFCPPALVQKFIEKGADVNLAIADDKKPIYAAARRDIGGLAVVKILLEAGALLPEDDGEEFIASTALKFFEERSDASGPSEGAFVSLRSVEQVLSQGPGAVVKLLLQQFPRAKAVSKEYGLLLQMAALEVDRQCVDLLLQRGVNINIMGYYYGTALQAAAYKGNLNVVERLLSAGADPNLLGGRYDTAFRATVAGGMRK